MDCTASLQRHGEIMREGKYKVFLATEITVRSFVLLKVPIFAY
jgi:hypothetical protein